MPDKDFPKRPVISNGKEENAVNANCLCSKTVKNRNRAIRRRFFELSQKCSVRQLELIEIMKDYEKVVADHFKARIQMYLQLKKVSDTSVDMLGFEVDAIAVAQRKFYQQMDALTAMMAGYPLCTCQFFDVPKHLDFLHEIERTISEIDEKIDELKGFILLRSTQLKSGQL